MVICSLRPKPPPNLYKRQGKRHNLLNTCFVSSLRDDPDSLCQVDFRPARACHIGLPLSVSSSIFAVWPYWVVQLLHCKPKGSNLWHFKISLPFVRGKKQVCHTQIGHRIGSQSIVPALTRRSGPTEKLPQVFKARDCRDPCRPISYCAYERGDILI